LARILAQVADSLAEYDHLPPLQFIQVTRRGTCRARLAGWGNDELVALVTWAKAFNVPVVFDRTDASSMGAINVRTTVLLAGREVVLTVMVIDLGRADGLAINSGATVPFGLHVEVSAEALLAVLDGEQVSA
jgi:hypothetical protein